MGDLLWAVTVAFAFIGVMFCVMLAIAGVSAGVERIEEWLIQVVDKRIRENKSE